MAEGEAHAKQMAYASSFGCDCVCAWQGCGHCFGMRGICPSSVRWLPGKSPWVAPSPVPVHSGRLSFAPSPATGHTSGQAEGAGECVEIPLSPNRNICCCCSVLSDKIKHKQRNLLRSLPPSDGGMSSARPAVSAKSRRGNLIAFLLRLPQLPHLDVLCLRASCCGILGIPHRAPSRIAPPRTSPPRTLPRHTCKLSEAVGYIPGIDR